MVWIAAASNELLDLSGDVVDTTAIGDFTAETAQLAFGTAIAFFQYPVESLLARIDINDIH